jgi:hypothetical protein
MPDFSAAWARCGRTVRPSSHCDLHRKAGGIFGRTGQIFKKTFGRPILAPPASGCQTAGGIRLPLALEHDDRHVVGNLRGLLQQVTQTADERVGRIAQVRSEQIC